MASTPARERRRFSPPGEGVRVALFKAGHPHCPEAVVDPAPDLRGGQAEIPRPEGDVLLHRHPDDLAVRVLKNHPHQPPDLPEAGGIGGLHPVHPHLARRREQQGVEMPDERRLAAAVRTDQGRMEARFDREADPLEDVGRLRFVAVEQIFHADHRV